MAVVVVNLSSVDGSVGFSRVKEYIYIFLFPANHTRWYPTQPAHHHLNSIPHVYSLFFPFLFFFFPFFSLDEKCFWFWLAVYVFPGFFLNFCLVNNFPVLGRNFCPSLPPICCGGNLLDGANLLVQIDPTLNPPLMTKSSIHDNIKTTC